MPSASSAPTLFSSHALLLFPYASSAAAASLGPALDALYDTCNGGYFWGRALLVRPKQAVANGPLSITAWNDTAVWKRLYRGACDDVALFAEDAFGIQIGIRGNEVVQFDPETATLTHLAPTLDDWAALVVADSSLHTGAPVLDAWERLHGPIDVGWRLVPRQPFMLGGDFSVDNMVVKQDVTAMQIRAGLWEHTKDLPDGASIRFAIVED